MKNTIQLLQQNNSPSSSGLTPEFKSFFTTFKRELTKELKKYGATIISFNRGHLDASGFYQVGSQVFYFSLPDVRGGVFDTKLMYRTAEHSKDFSGGANRWVSIESGMGEIMCRT